MARPKLAYGNTKIVEEAFERKHGGKVSAPRMDKKYASGGGVGSDKSPMAPGSAKNPFSSAKKGG